MSGAVASLLATLILLLLPGDEPHPITHSDRGAFEASLTPFGDGFATAWYDTRDGHPEIYARLLDRRGQPAGPERRLTNGTDRAYEADIAAIANDLVVAWYEVGPNRSSHAMLGLWRPDGQRVWAKALAAPERISKNPVVRTTKHEIFCAWLSENAARDLEVYGAWFDLKGNPLAPAQRLGAAGQTTWNINATIDDRGVAWVTFDARVDTAADELFLARVDRTTSHLTRLTTDDGKASKYPDVAVANGRLAVTWFDERDGNQEVYLFVGDVKAIEDGVESGARRITNTPGHSIGAYVAWNARRHRFGLAWCDDSEGQHEVYFQSFDDSGRSTQPVQRLTDNPTDSLIPAIKPAGDGFALVWNEYAATRTNVHQDGDARSELAFAFAR